jgi:hypothetical protein
MDGRRFKLIEFGVKNLNNRIYYAENITIHQSQFLGDNRLYALINQPANIETPMRDIFGIITIKIEDNSLIGYLNTAHSQENSGIHKNWISANEKINSGYTLVTHGTGYTEKGIVKNCTIHGVYLTDTPSFVFEEDIIKIGKIYMHKKSP